MSKLLATKNTGLDFVSLLGTGNFVISSRIFSIPTPCWAEIGIIGQDSAGVPLINSLIAL